MKKCEADSPSGERMNQQTGKDVDGDFENFIRTTFYHANLDPPNRNMPVERAYVYRAETRNRQVILRDNYDIGMILSKPAAFPHIQSLRIPTLG